MPRKTSNSRSIKLKYDDIVLPDCVDNVNGYHFGCRKNFLAIPKKYIEKYKQLEDECTEVNVNPALVTAALTSFASVSGN